MKKGKKYFKLNLQVIDWGQPIMGRLLQKSDFYRKVTFFAVNIPFLHEILMEKQKRKNTTNFEFFKIIFDYMYK